MRLSNKITLGATGVLVLTNLLVLTLVVRRNENALLQALTQTARSYSRLVFVLRDWIPEGEGIWVRRGPGREPSPYVHLAQVETVSGDTLVWRNAAMLAREFSERSRAGGVGVHFRLTSLHPINPANAPDSFEVQALQAIEAGRYDVLSPRGEFTRMENANGVRTFRYLAPLYNQGCTGCHMRSGWRPGRVLGGISIALPVDPMVAAANGGLLFTLAGALVTALAVSLAILWLLRRSVLRPLRRLEDAAQEIGRGNLETEILSESRDEIGDVGRAMMRMQGDLLKRLREQVQTEKMVALGQLSAGIAHEIRNPLFALRNDLDFLQRHYPGDPQQEEVHRSMEEGLTRIGELVSGVLDYSRPHHPEFGRHTVEEVVTRCEAMTGKQLAKQHVTLDVQLEPDMPAVEMDVHAMQQVLVNLITNGMNAHRGGEGYVRVSGRSLPDAVEIDVADDGEGIAAEDLPRIFDPFFTRSNGGTGLGLTIVQRIMHQHHGTIDVQSEPGRGTTITLRLPRVQPKQDAA